MDTTDELNDNQGLQDIRGILRRRKKIFLAVFAGIFLFGTVTAFILPPIYKSTTMVLIEAPQIPSEYVKTTVTGYVEERLQAITQQLMIRKNLLRIIDRFGLYIDKRNRKTTDQIVKEMMEDINLETISAEGIDKRTGRTTSATIAFALSFEGKKPATVQKVANELASLYLEENLRARGLQAAGTTKFFQQELNDLKQKINLFENDISVFKQAHMGELPEYTMLNLQAMERLNRDLDQTDTQLRSLKDRKVYLEGQLTSIDPLAPVVNEEGQTIMNPEERLKYLRTQLVSLKASFSDKHPDIIKLKKEITELESQTDAPEDTTHNIRQLKELKGQLTAIKGRLGLKHPDVIKKQKEIAALSSKINNKKPKEISLEIARQEADNPAYLNIKTQIVSASMEIDSLLELKESIREKIDAYQKKLENMPSTEKSYNELMHDYTNAKHKYSEIMDKLLEAEVAQGMEESRRGERFTIVDPAHLPERPHKPNRIAIILISFVLAMGAATGIAAIAEHMDNSVKTTDELSRFTNLPVLSAIHWLQTEEEISAQKRKRILLASFGVALFAGVLVLVHIHAVPLDILWIKIQRRFM
jgi:uncharacterized protein involved in exopolysaccharide biosynthesis